MNRIRVMLVDDHRIMRQGLRSLIESEDDLEVVAEAGDGQTALAVLEAARPDVLILDISMPGMSGIVLLERLRQQRQAPRALVLSAYADSSYIRQVLEAGAVGFVLKRSAAEELINAIRMVVAGGTYLDPAVAGKVAAGYVETSKGRVPRKAGKLTQREREVLRDVARGYSNKEIANRLGIGVKTVETHKANALEKLELHSRADAVRYALHQGWLTDT